MNPGDGMANDERRAHEDEDRARGIDDGAEPAARPRPAAGARAVIAPPETRRARRAQIVAETRASEARRTRAVRRRWAAAAALLIAAIVLAAIIVPRLAGEGAPDAEQAAAPTRSDLPATQPPPSEATAAGDASGTAPATAAASAAAPGTGPGGIDLTTASSLQVLVNKRTPLDPRDYAPADLVAMSDLGIPSQNGHSLRAEAAQGIVSLFAAARAAGHELDMTSGYRDAQLQRQLYDGYVEELGQAGADATSARPGYSEHQTGLAADISAPSEGCALAACFAQTGAGRWLAEHAWEHGFILRYPAGETATTGYEYEPWHFRYVGVETARAYRDSGATTYEAFVGAPAAPDYAS